MPLLLALLLLSTASADDLDIVHVRVLKTFYPSAASVKSDRVAAEKVRRDFTTGCSSLIFGCEKMCTSMR
jgi:hypothetical protein